MAEHAGRQPVRQVLNESEKFVASRSLEEPLPWAHSILLEGDAVQAVTRLKDSNGPDLVILGSGELIRSLLPHRLIDEIDC